VSWPIEGSRCSRRILSTRRSISKRLAPCAPHALAFTIVPWPLSTKHRSFGFGSARTPSTIDLSAVRRGRAVARSEVRRRREALECVRSSIARQVI
jgi:hypothetical protein